MPGNSPVEMPTFKIPDSLKTLIAKLPTPEAIQILQDIGNAAWVNDNNNNNKAASALENRFIEKLGVIESKRLTEILEAKG